MKGRLIPVGGRKPTRQLTLQPESSCGEEGSNSSVQAHNGKDPFEGISERADQNEN
jgi:hypothetical protein